MAPLTLARRGPRQDGSVVATTVVYYHRRLTYEWSGLAERNNVSDYKDTVDCGVRQSPAPALRYVTCIQRHFGLRFILIHAIFLFNISFSDHSFVSIHARSRAL